LDESPLFCHRCAVELEPGRGDFYLIRIEAVADPTPPTITKEDLERDHAAEIDRLFKATAELSDQEAMDQVYRRLTIHLCGACYSRWIEDPTR